MGYTFDEGKASQSGRLGDRQEQHDGTSKGFRRLCLGRPEWN